MERAVPDETGGRAIVDIVSSDFDLLLGRKIYEHFESSWSHNQHPIGKAFDKAVKYVVSRTLDTLTWHRSERISNDVVSDIRALKARDGFDLQVCGISPRPLTLTSTRSSPRGVLINTYRTDNVARADSNS